MVFSLFVFFLFCSFYYFVFFVFFLLGYVFFLVSLFYFFFFFYGECSFPPCFGFFFSLQPAWGFSPQETPFSEDPSGMAWSPAPSVFLYPPTSLTNFPPHGWTAIGDSLSVLS